MSPVNQSSESVTYSNSSKSNPWFGVSLGLIGVIVGYGLGTWNITPGTVAAPQQIAQAPTPTPSAPVPTPSTATPAGVDDDEVLGDEDAEITLIEFTDYQCPFCQRHFTDTHNQIKTQYIDTGKVKLVVRDYPLSFHPHAQKAAEATECAADQDKFFEMHDLLFKNGAAWSNLPDALPTFKQYAKDLGLDAGDFDSCLDDGTHAGEVAKDMADGSAAGISGTPGFWILGPDDQNQQISGAYPFASFQAAFDSMLD